MWGRLQPARGFSRAFTGLLTCLSLLATAESQTLPVTVERPQGPFIIRPYEQTRVPPIRLSNSARLSRLVRAGKLYLTVPDAIALAIENNLDLEVERYGILTNIWEVQRAEAGGPLKGVPSGTSQIGNVASGQGVTGSIASAGLSGNNGGNNGNSAGGASVSQVGPVTLNLDAVLQHATTLSHITRPQSNTVVSQTTSLVQVSHIFSTSVQQGFLAGGYVQVSQNESYLKESTPADVLNPSVAPRVQIYVQQSLLQGLGSKVNGRFIRVAKNNLLASNATFRSRLTNIVTDVLNQYWDLVTAYEDMTARQRDMDIARKFFEDTRRRIEIGTVAKVDLFRAQAEYSLRQELFADSQAAERQRENGLKNIISRTGIADPVIAEASVVPLDRFPTPSEEPLPPLRELVARAMAKRPDIAATGINVASAAISTIGTQNGLLPTLQGIASTTSNGLAGVAQRSGGTADSYFVGGLGTALGQVFRRDFPNNRAAIVLQPVPVFIDHPDQADYAIDQLQFRQTQLNQQRDLNQLAVDISNQVVALRQARARYQAAVKTRTVQDRLLEGEQEKFSLGSSTIDAVVIAQRALALAQGNETTALAAYIHARIALDQVLGETLERNNVSVDEGLEGRIPRESSIPADK